MGAIQNLDFKIVGDLTMSNDTIPICCMVLLLIGLHLSQTGVIYFWCFIISLPFLSLLHLMYWQELHLERSWYLFNGSADQLSTSSFSLIFSWWPALLLLLFQCWGHQQCKKRCDPYTKGFLLTQEMDSVILVSPFQFRIVCVTRKLSRGKQTTGLP